MPDLSTRLRDHDINPSAQRIAVARYVLSTDHHPRAEQVFRRVRAGFPMISRATVYNTLNLFVDRGLLRALVLSGRSVIFDPQTRDHPHFVDVDSGRIMDLPAECITVQGADDLEGFEVQEVQVVLRGRRRP